MSLRTTPPPEIMLKTTAQRRARINPELKSKLEEEYKKNSKPNKSEKHRIAFAFDMTDDNVHFWFQNRRARASRESKKRKASSDHGDSGTAKRISSHQTDHQASHDSQASSPSCHPTAVQQKDFTTIPSVIAPRPRLPSIVALFDSQGGSLNSTSAPLAHPPTYASLVSSYFHHPPYGIESSYLAWQVSQSLPSSE
ncbi:hypothetical protein BCR42DRAFT_449146 [Absidia repens]|uniref:Homeobox domain-containing protein n=1 Tax=Absidia repens TaxID=90262 RepID=A0A1X2IPD4_9FUNG|nr:hypothetical protein BCR42DRAFT_449146 [Absidia repens]